MTNTAAATPTTADLTAAFIASGKKVTQCPPANAVPPSPQSAPVVPAKTSKRVKAAVAKTLKPDTTDAAPAKAAKAPKAKAAKTPAAKATAKAGSVTLASICADIDMTPKAARAILRRKMTKPADGWSFDAATAKKVRALLDA